MSHLVTITINAVANRISTEDLALTYPWDGDIIEFSPTSFSLDYINGGYARPRFGSIAIAKSRFASDWPPPASCAVKHELTDTNEAAAVTVFEGTGHCRNIAGGVVEYNLHGDTYDTTINGVTFADTLTAIFTTYCAGAYLNLTLDTNATGRAPAISRASVSSDELLIDVLSEMAAAVNHFFYIENGTLYLCDMLANNGTTSLDEFDFRPVEYKLAAPVSLFRSGTYTVDGSYVYGSEKSLSTVDFVIGNNVIPNVTSSKAIIEKPTVTIKLGAEAGYKPTMGEKISFTDDSIGPEGVSTTVWFRVRSISFVDNGDQLIITGEGAIS